MSTELSNFPRRYLVSYKNQLYETEDLAISEIGDAYRFAKSLSRRFSSLKTGVHFVALANFDSGFI